MLGKKTGKGTRNSGKAKDEKLTLVCVDDLLSLKVLERLSGRKALESAPYCCLISHFML